MITVSEYVLGCVGCAIVGFLVCYGILKGLFRGLFKKKPVDTLDISRPPYDQRNPLNMRVPRNDRFYKDLSGT